LDGVAGSLFHLWVFFLHVLMAVLAELLMEVLVAMAMAVFVVVGLWVLHIFIVGTTLVSLLLIVGQVHCHLLQSDRAPEVDIHLHPGQYASRMFPPRELGLTGSLNGANDPENFLVLNSQAPVRWSILTTSLYSPETPTFWYVM
jgi:hypothetical protein